MTDVFYRPFVREGFEWLNCKREEDYELFWSLDGRPRGRQWTPIEVVRVRRDLGRSFERSDFPWFGSWALVLSERAVGELRVLLEAHGELLPLIDDHGEPLWLFNVRAIDCLDREASEILYFPDSSQIMAIEKVVFELDSIGAAQAFRLPQRASTTYVCEGFVEAVRASQLVGIEFIEVFRRGS